MKLSLPPDRLAAYVADQLSSSFPDYTLGVAGISPALALTIERVEYCFSRIRDKYFVDGKDVVFNHLHSDQYAMFLYLLSHTVWSVEENEEVAARIYGLNKHLHAIDVFYQVELPDIFLFNHCIGTVLGRAQYANYLMVHHNCTIGANYDGEYPIIEEGVVMHAGSVIAGRCHIRTNSWLEAGAIVIDSELPAGQVIFGQYPDMRCKQARRNVRDIYFTAG